MIQQLQRVTSVKALLRLSSSLAPPWQAKALVGLLLLLNIRNFPTFWHFRVLLPWFRFALYRRLGYRLSAANDKVGKDPLKHVMTKNFRAHLSECDAFGGHLSNSSYASATDHVRGPYTVTLGGPVFEIPGAKFGLGATSYSFLREIPLLAKYTVVQEIAGYDKKWLYQLTRFISTSRSGKTTTHALLLSHVVVKLGRRTVPPARLFALAGYGKDHGAANWEIVKTMSDKERATWVVGEGEDRGIVVGPLEVGMEGKSEWPGQL